MSRLRKLSADLGPPRWAVEGEGGAFNELGVVIRLEAERGLGYALPVRYKALLSGTGYARDHLGTFATRQAAVRAIELGAQIRDQLAFVAEHGRTLEGYVERYGTAAEPKDGTLGGPAVFDSDTAMLAELTRQLTELAHEAGR
jgi:hypothetical protein